VAQERFLALMVEPYQGQWRDFHPLTNTGGRPGAVPDPAISGRVN
jgi:hypothetical protein